MRCAPSDTAFEKLFTIHCDRYGIHFIDIVLPSFIIAYARAHTHENAHNCGASLSSIIPQAHNYSIYTMEMRRVRERKRGNIYLKNAVQKQRSQRIRRRSFGLIVLCGFFSSNYYDPSCFVHI